MGRIEDRFAKLKEENKKALIGFITAGDPDLKTTADLIKEMENKGADLIELGIPYSDPVAEGPVIQRANERALKNKIKIGDIMNMVGEIRKTTQVPLLYLLYFNCILRYGPERFFKDCSLNGIDGLIIPDLPYEEKDEVSIFAEKYNVHIITLVAPTSRERISKITRDAKGFLYCISSLGVTGMRNKFDADFEKMFSYIEQFTHIPKAIGFGIYNKAQVAHLKHYGDGLIIGSAIVKIIEESKCPEEAVKRVGEFIAGMREELDK
ncbi:MAG: tryptophan synthase subunit alpha [Firmicutes bacterium]|nr:tryptophan synthase subunit alpha [Bacillota bacterium]